MVKEVQLACATLTFTDKNNSTGIDQRKLYEEISLEEYIQEHPQYHKKYSVFFKLLTRTQKESLIKNHVITYSDYKILVDRAKQTKFGLLILTIGEQKVVFTANPSVQNQLITLETVPNNEYTARILKTGNNQRLLENNPVAAKELDLEHNYIQEQQEFFSTIALSENFTNYVQSVFPTNTERTELTRKKYVEIIGKSFSKLYFQILFSNSDYTRSDSCFIDNDIAQNVENIYQKINSLYAEIEACTGKHELTFGKFLQISPTNETSQPASDNKLIPLLYEIICGIYGEKFDPMMTDEKTLASAIINLMDKHHARVLPVFAKLPNPINKCFNLLSWLDNSLNIINTLSNFAAKIGDEKSPNEQNHLSLSYIYTLLPEMRALATLFMREIKPEAQIVLSFTGYPEQIVMNNNYRLMMTNSITGAVFGANGRKCPSHKFSFKIIGEFIHQFFAHYIVKPASYQKTQSMAENNSWFWNIFQPTNKNSEILMLLNQYIDKIETYTNKQGVKDYQHGFWHHKQSRAINRQGNYLLAIKLRDMFMDTRTFDGVYGTHGGNTTNKNTHTLKEAILIYRESLMRDMHLADDPYFSKAISRGINSSDLNQSLCIVS